jgi:hypothetical protein
MMATLIPQHLKLDIPTPLRVASNEVSRTTIQQVPTLESLEQQPQGTQNNSNTPAPEKSTEATSGYQVSPTYSPDETVIKERFKNWDMNWKGLQIGLLAGTVTGLLAGGLSYALKSRSLVELGMEAVGKGGDENRIRSAIFSGSEALGLGAIVGFTVGGDINHRVQTKLEQISALEKGETPKQPWQDKLNPFAKKPPTTKQEAIDELNEKELDSRTAFSTGAWHGFWEKTVSVTLAIPIIQLSAKLDNPALTLLATGGLGKDLAMKFAKHPTAWLKAVAIPIMGGVIGVKTLPILKEKVKAADKPNALADRSTFE